MNKYDNLLSKISYEYLISKGRTETVDHLKTRIIYSMLGKMGLSSVWDLKDDGEVSIIHMKNRIRSVFKSYQELYPEIQGLMVNNAMEMADEIVDIYLKTGCIYHEPHRVAMAIPSVSEPIEGLYLTRGYQIDKDQKMSGLGTYCDTQDVSGKSCSAQVMFQLNDGQLSQRWETRIEHAEWEQHTIENNVEYLRMVKTFKDGYWGDKPDLKERVSLLRIGSPGAWVYYLYKLEKDQLFVSQLPQWIYEDNNHRTLANECLSYHGLLPKITYKDDGEIVYTRFGYLLPPAELYFCKLYSWPVYYKDSFSDFQRIFTKEIFKVVRDVLELQGYVFVKE